MVAQNPRGAIGAFLNRPQATNAARAPITIFTGTKENSPRERWKAAASSMISTNPAAASGVSFGITRVAEGRIKPSQPSSSESPMKRTSASGIAPGQVICAISSGIGPVSL